MNPWLKEQKIYALNITEYESSFLQCTINNSTVANLFNATNLDMLCDNFKFDENNDDASEEGNEKEGNEKEGNEKEGNEKEGNEEEASKKEGRKAVETKRTFRNGTEGTLQNGTDLSYQDLLEQCELAPIDAYTELTFSYNCKVSKCEAIATELNICQTDKTECDESSDNFNPDLTLTLEKIGIRVNHFTDKRST